MAHVLIHFEDGDLPDLYVSGATKNLVLELFREGSPDCSYPPVPADPRANEPSKATHYIGTDPTEILLTIGIAIEQQSNLAIKYKDKQGKVTNRTVTPIRVEDGERLVAYDQDQNAPRNFRIDRIESALTELVT